MNWMLPLLLWLCQPVLAQQQAIEPRPTVVQLLEKLDQARTSLSYQGPVVFQHKNRLETFLLKRSADPVEGGEYVISTNGPLREMLRRDQWVRCVLPENGDSLVDARLISGLFPQLSAMVLERTRQAYHWQVVGKNRVANRPAWQLRAVARDPLRFSHEYWLDAQWGVLLGHVLLGEQYMPLEQTVFVDFRVEENLKLPPGHLLGKQHLSVQAASEAQLSQEGAPPWAVKQLPAGFQLMGYQQVTLPDGEQQWQLRYGDGLAEVTVYVEPMIDKPLEGVFNMGPVNAYGRVIGQQQVVVMGPVPVKTLQYFSNHLELTTADRS